MTPNPPNSSNGSPLPPRHRPDMKNLSKDTTELDLWAFDEDLTEPEDLAEPAAKNAIPPMPINRKFSPQPIDSNNSFPNQSPEPDRVRMDINQAKVKPRASGLNPAPVQPERDLNSFDHWEMDDLPDDLPESPAATVAAVPATQEVLVETEPSDLKAAMPEPAAVFTEEIPAEKSAGIPKEDDEISALPATSAAPISLRPSLGLTAVERIGLIVLAALLLIGGGGVFITSLNRLPTAAAKAEDNDFPIKGNHCTITAANSYWRAPITDGPTPDVFRRDTQLLPVIELTTSGKAAAIRILFRNDEGQVVGDPVTRTVTDGAVIKVAATAGFDNIGMHAAYRTGGSKPWTIAVFEAPSGNATPNDFKPLFEMNISTDRR